MSNEHNNAPAVRQGEQATIAGLDAANGHLSTLLDDSVLMLKQLRQMVDDLHERWSNGGKPERGEFELLDRVDDWLSCRPDSMLSPPTPNVLQEPVMWQYRTWFAENTGTPGWSEWAEVKARNAYTGTVMDSVREFQHYIAQGYKYEIRALYAATPAPAPAQEVSDKHEREMLEVIDERDRINEWADQLADAIAKHTGYEIGEHTSANNPWRMALNALVCHEAKQEVGLTDEALENLIEDLSEWSRHVVEDTAHQTLEAHVREVLAKSAIIAALRAKEDKHA